jgi:hypothetical protein
MKVRTIGSTLKIRDGNHTLVQPMHGGQVTIHHQPVRRPVYNAFVDGGPLPVDRVCVEEMGGPSRMELSELELEMNQNGAFGPFDDLFEDRESFGMRNVSLHDLIMGGM